MPLMTRDRATRGILKSTSTMPHLAQRLGHVLEKAFSRTVPDNFSHENRVARVTWRRE
jgi:hypothetical protein